MASHYSTQAFIIYNERESTRKETQGYSPPNYPEYFMLYDILYRV